MSEKRSSYPDFHQDFDSLPTLEEAEQAKVAGAFNQLVNDLMLQNMALVEQYELIPNRPKAHLLLKGRVEGRQYTLGVEDCGQPAEDGDITPRPSQKIKRLIALQRIEGSYGRESSSYRLGTDDVVRRFDIPNPVAARAQETDFFDATEEEEITTDILTAAQKRVQNNLDDLANYGIPNANLEEDMGLNNQPITAEEIDGLRQFIAKLELEPIKN